MRLSFFNQSHLDAKLAQANKALAKANLPAINAQNIEMVEQKTGQINCFGVEIINHVLMADIELPNAIAGLNGYRVLARKTATDSGNIIVKFDDNINLLHHADADIKCDHCKMNRNRKYSWLFLDPTGQIVEIGDSCANAYFGVDILALLEHVATARESFDEDGEWFEGKGFDFNGFVLAAAYLSATQGYISRKVAESKYCSPTSDEAYTISHSKNSSEQKIFADCIDWARVHGGCDAILDQIKAFVASIEPKTELESNLKIAYQCGDSKFYGFIAYACKLWVDSLAPKNTQSQHIGQIGDKLAGIAVSIASIKLVNTMYGDSQYIVFNDAENNQLLWRSSKINKISVGDKFKLSGTIKAHGNFNNINQTELTRCKLS